MLELCPVSYVCKGVYVFIPSSRERGRTRQCCHVTCNFSNYLNCDIYNRQIRLYTYIQSWEIQASTFTFALATPWPFEALQPWSVVRKLMLTYIRVKESAIPETDYKSSAFRCPARARLVVGLSLTVHCSWLTETILWSAGWRQEGKNGRGEMLCNNSGENNEEVGHTQEQRKIKFNT